MGSGVSLVIVVFNSGPVLIDCLQAVSKQTLLPKRVILVDNASTDDSFENASTHLKSISHLAGRFKLLKNTRNIGFAAANNAAVACCDTDFVALLNPDAIPEPDWLEKLMAAACRHPRAAAFASRQMLDIKKDLIDGLGDVYNPAGICWRRRHGKVLRPGDLVESETSSACAAAVLYRRPVFLELGGFDENFFCYVEDVDFGLRLRQRGYRSVFVPDAVVTHTSKNSRSDFAVYHGHRNIVWCFFKNTPPSFFVFFLAAHIFQTILACVACTFRGQGGVFLRSKKDALQGLRTKRGTTFVNRSKNANGEA